MLLNPETIKALTKIPVVDDDGNQIIDEHGNLKWLEFNETSLAAIQKWDKLVAMLDAYVANCDKTGVRPFKANENINGGLYSQNNKDITLSENSLDSTDQYDVVLILVHEATHAIQDLPAGSPGLEYVKYLTPDVKTTTLAEYANKANKLEAEATM
jgi:hypothetical protein